jgi:alkylation response protein AidB-like acyl-CoA dehydrogenase
MSLSGIINTHFIVAYLIAARGTQEQQDFFLPKMATGEVRSALSMSEPDLGSDVAAIRTAARRDGDDYVISGQKMWLTNGATSSLVALLARTEEDAGQPHRNLTAFLIEKAPGFGETGSGLTVPGKGFYQFMDGIEVGRVNVAAGGQSDVEAGMAKYLAAEYCKEVVRTACGSTAATATRPSTRSSGCTGTRRCC